jgi:hypothetical protein
LQDALEAPDPKETKSKENFSAMTTRCLAKLKQIVLETKNLGIIFAKKTENRIFEGGQAY